MTSGLNIEPWHWSSSNDTFPCRMCRTQLARGMDIYHLNQPYDTPSNERRVAFPLCEPCAHMLMDVSKQYAAAWGDS